MDVIGTPSSCLILVSSRLVFPNSGNLILPSVRSPWRSSLFSGSRFRQRASQRHSLRTPRMLSPQFFLHPFDLSLGSSVVQDTAAMSLVLVGAYSLVRCFDSLTEKGLIGQKLSRKLVHILSGLLFMASWPLFRELLRGPLYYVLVLMCSSLFFWRESPAGVIPLTMMCAGDGVADIMGRNFGTQKLPYNEQKSWVGSISMFIFGVLSSLGMLFYFQSLGYFLLDWGNASINVVLISLVATIVESLPITKVFDDNISVPLISMSLALLLFGHQPH